MILIELAEFGLAWRKSWDLGAQGLGTDHVQLRISPHLIALDSKIPAGDRKSQMEALMSADEMQG